MCVHLTALYARRLVRNQQCVIKAGTDRRTIRTGFFFFVQGLRMYEMLIERAEQAAYLANQYRIAGDELMSIFWSKASEGYKVKANNLTVGEAE